jgi:hypothetical protein
LGLGVCAARRKGEEKIVLVSAVMTDPPVSVGYLRVITPNKTNRENRNIATPPAMKTNQFFLGSDFLKLNPK